MTLNYATSDVPDAYDARASKWAYLMAIANRVEGVLILCLAFCLLYRAVIDLNDSLEVIRQLALKGPDSVGFGDDISRFGAWAEVLIASICALVALVCLLLSLVPSRLSRRNAWLRYGIAVSLGIVNIIVAAILLFERTTGVFSLCRAFSCVNALLYFPIYGLLFVHYQKSGVKR